MATSVSTTHNIVKNKPDCNNIIVRRRIEGRFCELHSNGRIYCDFGHALDLAPSLNDCSINVQKAIDDFIGRQHSMCT